MFSSASQHVPNQLDSRSTDDYNTESLVHRTTGTNHCQQTLSQNNDQEKGSETGEERVGIRHRLKHFTWAWFTCTMSTGGMGILLGQTPHRFHGLYTIGVLAFVVDLIIFGILCTCMALRLILHPHHFLKSLITPPECLFSGAFWLSIATVLGNIQVYAISMGPAWPWLVCAMHILFWIYSTITLLNVVWQYWAFMKFAARRPIPASPAWFLPGYSAMLTGTVASLIAESQPEHRRMVVVIAGAAYQGLGWTLSLCVIVMYLLRLLEEGLPPGAQRPGMFIPIGSVGYSIVAFIGCSKAIPKDYGYFAVHPAVVEILQCMALFFSIVLWLFMFFLWSLALLSCIDALRSGTLGFSLPWWGLIFPNVGFTVGTIDIGIELGSGAMLWLGSVLTIILVALWFVTAGFCVHAVLTKKIVWPGRDEDKTT